MSAIIKRELEVLSGPFVLSMPTETWNLFASIGKKSKTIDIKLFSKQFIAFDCIFGKNNRISLINYIIEQ